MNCDDTREKIGTLDVADFGRLSHLSECEECRAFAELAEEAEHQIALHVDDFASRVSFDEALQQISEPTQPRRFDMPRILHTTLVALASAAAIAVAVSPILGDMSDRAASLMGVEADAQEKWIIQVSARDLHVGDTITEEDLYAVEISRDFVHDDTFPISTDIFGEVVTAPILANEVISCKRLTHCEGAISGSPKTASWRPTALLPEGTGFQIQAVRPLPAGHLIQRRDLYAAQMPENLIPPNSFTEWDQMIGVKVTSHIFADEPIRCERLDIPCP